jgi:hypothetical protein
VRFKYTVVVLLIAIVGTPTMPVIGQEEPLPAIHPRGSFEPLTPSIALAVDPIRDLAQGTTIVDAARANDYAAFDTLYRDAAQRGELVGAFAALHELWTFSMTDPVGAFYGAETYQRLTRAYPGFARYIEEYRIVDANGNAFYPTSETRTFLLDRALEGRAPRVQIAESGSRSTQQRNVSATADSTPAEQTTRRSVPARTSTGTRAMGRDSVASTGERAAPRVTAKRAVAEKAPVVAREKAPVPVAEKPPVVIAEKAATPVVVAEQPSAPVQQPVQQTSQQASQQPAVQPEPAAVAVDNNFGTRGIFLLLIGIVGIGILAMMLRTPREAPQSLMAPPAETTPPPVEPLKRPTAAPQPPSNAKNRANGSRG